MKADVHGDIETIVGLQNVSDLEVTRAFGVRLTVVHANSHCRFFESGPAGIFEDVGLDLSLVGPSWLLSLKYIDAFRPLENEIDMSRYGPVVDVGINPDIPPEGTVTRSFDYKGCRLSFQFAARTKGLRAVIVRKD